MEAVVTVTEESALQGAVVQLGHVVGMPPKTPACDQSTARLGSMIPDHCCAPAEDGTKSNARESKNSCLRFIGQLLSVRRVPNQRSGLSILGSKYHRPKHPHPGSLSRRFSCLLRPPSSYPVKDSSLGIEIYWHRDQSTEDRCH